MAVIVGMGGQPKLVHDEFDIMELEQPAVRELIERVDATLRDNGEERRKHHSCRASRVECSVPGFRYYDEANDGYERGGNLVSQTSETRHVLGLSGGRDSAALAVYMRQKSSRA